MRRLRWLLAVPAAILALPPVPPAAGWSPTAFMPWAVAAAAVSYAAFLRRRARRA